MSKVIKFYDDLNFWEKVLYKLRLKKALSFKREDFENLAVYTFLQEKYPRVDKSFKQVIEEEFNQCQTVNQKSQ